MSSPSTGALVAGASLWLLAAAPAPLHIATSDYFAGYAGTHAVAPQVASRWLTWAETDVATSRKLRPLGIKTLLYTDPNRTMRGDPEFSQDESTFAHDCRGARVEANRAGQYLMNPHSAALLDLWKRHVDRYVAEGQFDAVLSDDANTIAYVRSEPCGYSAPDWLAATNAMQKSLQFPVIYNGLSNFTDRTVSPSIGLNASAIGGMMEQCYAGGAGSPATAGDAWIVAENTELRMAAAHKTFLCYGNDTSPAADVLDRRLYVYASFLLSYDPQRSVLWEYYEGTSHFHVMPETQLVALQPERRVGSIQDIQTRTGVYERVYRACYLRGAPVGRCVIAVNPDLATHRLSLSGYTRTIALAGGSIVDGGSVRIIAARPPSELDGRSAELAFR